MTSVRRHLAVPSVQPRRWSAGDALTVDGLQLRIVVGNKGRRDLRLEWFVDGAWRPVRMKLGAVMADFFYENEDELYPPDEGFEGGYRYLRFCRLAALEGWHEAERTLTNERTLLAEKENG